MIPVGHNNEKPWFTDVSANVYEGHHGNDAAFAHMYKGDGSNMHNHDHDDCSSSG